MMMIRNTGTKALTFMALLLVASPNYANRANLTLSTPACDSQSASLLQLGDQYYDLTPDPQAISAENASNLQDLYDSLQGRWEGSITEHYCLGGGSNTTLKTKTRELKHVQASIGGLGHLRFRANGLSIELAAASELNSLVVLDNHTLSSSLRYRRSATEKNSGVRTAPLRERQDTLTLDDNEKILRLETNWYFNGYYTGTELTSLRKIR